MTDHSPLPLTTAPPAVVADRYRLGEVLGRGGMADVYRGHDLVLDRPVAVKVLRDPAGDASDRARFTAEARTLAMLSHPELVTVLDAGVEVEQPFLVMELVEGATLADLLRTGRLAPARAAVIGAQVASALAYAHDAGVVHRDVKPANVLLGDGDRVKLADFGIARLVGDTVRHTRTGMAIGTAAYLSPEQVGGEDVTGAADVYSLGLVLLEALTGTRAFPGSPTEAALARLSRDPEVPATSPPGWAELLRAATARDPAARPSADEVARRLRFLAGPPPAPPRGYAVPPEAPSEARSHAAPDAATTRPLTAVVPAAPPAAPPVAPAAGPSPGRRVWSAVADRWRSTPADQRGLAAAALALVLLVVVAALAAGGSGDPEPVGPVPADTPAEYRGPLQELHDAVGGS